jgi:DNA-binding MarR family transcriptional regulator
MTIARAILVVLDQVRPNLMPERALLLDVSAQGISITPTELHHELDRIEALRFILSVRNTLDQSVRYTITDTGRAALAG